MKTWVSAWVVCQNDFPACVVMSESAAKSLIEAREKEELDNIRTDANRRAVYWHYREVPLWE